MIKHGNWKTITIADDGTTSSETDLGGEFQDVQLYNPAIINGTLTIKVSRLTGDTALQAYTMDRNATGDFVNTTTARTSAGMNVFKDICARFITLVCGAGQTEGPLTFYARGITKMTQERS